MSNSYEARAAELARARMLREHPERFLEGRGRLADRRVVVWRATANGAAGNRDAPNTGGIRELDRRRGPQAWTATAAMAEGDLLLVHRAGVHGKVIRDLLEVTQHPLTDRTAGDWSTKVLETFVFVRRVAQVDHGITWEDWKTHPSLRASSHTKARMQGRAAVTDVWPTLHRLLVDRNRGLSRRLAPWEPQ